MLFWHSSALNFKGNFANRTQNTRIFHIWRACCLIWDYEISRWYEYSKFTRWCCWSEAQWSVRILTWLCVNKRAISAWYTRTLDCHLQGSNISQVADLNHWCQMAKCNSIWGHIYVCVQKSFNAFHQNFSEALYL